VGNILLVDVVHVLVEIPLTISKKRIIERPNIIAWADQTNWPSIKEPLPHLNALSKVMCKELPFSIGSVTQDYYGFPKFVFEGSDLITAFSCYCDRNYYGSESSYHLIYDSMFTIFLKLCEVRGLPVDFKRDQVDTSGGSLGVKRPDIMMLVNHTVFFRGEEKSNEIEISKAKAEIISKMQVWSPVLYGRLPYILCYATSGKIIQFYACHALHQQKRVALIDVGDELNLTTPSHQKQCLTIIFNMVRIFEALKKCVGKRHLTFAPFEEILREGCSVKIIDERIIVKKTICNNEKMKKRLKLVYNSVLEIAKTTQHMIGVEKIKEQDWILEAHLSPLGCEVVPENETELQCAIHGVLTALRAWHSKNFCHGDIRWANVLNVPSGGGIGHYMLIDFDLSFETNKKLIYWNHPRKGCRLVFGHDFYQVGDLMNAVPYLSTEALNFQKRLQDIENNPEGAQLLENDPWLSQFTCHVCTR
jgi:hypothetical protein